MMTNPTCYRCGGKMSEGYLIGRSGFFDSVLSRLWWHPGRLNVAHWLGACFDTNKLKSPHTLRCENCGLTELYTL
jgi:hypothetical protein